MAAITITTAGTHTSTFAPASDTTLPASTSPVPGVSATVDQGGSDPDVGLKVTEVKLEVSDLQTTDAATSGRFEVYHGTSLLFTVDLGAGGGAQSEPTNIIVPETSTATFSVKWKRLTAGTYLPATETVKLSVSTEDWEG